MIASGITARKGRAFSLVAALAMALLPRADANLLVDPTGGTPLWSDARPADDEATDEDRPLSFDFPFFDQTLSEIAVSTNGNLSVGADTEFDNTRTLTTVPRISPLWDDLEVQTKSGDAIVEKINPGVYYSVTWSVHEANSLLTRHHFQAVLFGAAARLGGFDFAAGDIAFSFGEIGPTFNKGSATAGLDAGDGATFVSIPEFAAGLVPHLLAGLLPTSLGSFLLFRPDGAGGYTVLLNHNRPPLAVDDRRYATPRRALDIDVRANDTDPDGDPLTVASVKQGGAGSVRILPGGALRYIPGPGFTGSDTFEYTLRDAAGLTATARVTLLPRLAAAGLYDGLIGPAPSEENPEPTVENETAGSFKIALGGGGSFSGLLRFGGFGYVLRGAFDDAGEFHTTLRRAGQPGGLRLLLHLDTTAEIAQLTGEIADGDTLAALRAGHTRFSARDFPAPAAGYYTVLLPLDDGTLAEPGANPLPGEPAGGGYAILRVTRGGSATLLGRLETGAAFSFASFVRMDATLPIHLPLRAPAGRPAGSLFGTLTFRDLPGISDADAPLHWFPAETDSPLGPPAGADTPLLLQACRYLPPPRATRALALADTPGNARLTLATGGADATLTPQNRLLIGETDLPRLTVTLQPTLGIFRGTFVEADPDTARPLRRTFTGVLLQKQRRGGGFMLSAGESTPVTLAPPAPE